MVKSNNAQVRFIRNRETERAVAVAVAQIPSRIVNKQLIITNKTDRTEQTKTKQRKRNKTYVDLHLR